MSLGKTLRVTRGQNKTEQSKIQNAHRKQGHLDYINPGNLTLPPKTSSIPLYQKSYICDDESIAVNYYVSTLWHLRSTQSAINLPTFVGFLIVM